MSKQLIAFFSVSGMTNKVATCMAEAKGADLYQILPAVPYTVEDLNYMNKESRSTLEMSNPDCRPEIVKNLENLGEYDTIILGFPLWWGREPSVVDTFLEAYDFTGKTVIPFCTSGGGVLGETPNRISTLLKGSATVEQGGRIAVDASAEELAVWPN